MSLGKSLGTGLGKALGRVEGGVEPVVVGDWANWDGSNDGAWTSIQSTTTARGHGTVAIDENRAFVVFKDDAPTGALQAFIATRSGTSISGGSIVQSGVSGLENFRIPSVTYMGNDRVLVVTQRNTDMYAEIWDTSGASPSWIGSAETDTISMTTAQVTLRPIDATKAMLVFQNNSNFMQGMVIDITGDTVTLGTPTNLIATSGTETSQVQMMNSTYFLAKSGSTNSDIVLGSVSGSTVTVEDTAAVNTDGEDFVVDPIYIEVFSETEAVLFFEATYGGVGSTRNTYAKVVTRSGDTISLGSPQDFITDVSNFSQLVDWGAGMNDNYGFLSLKKGAATYGKVYQLDGSTVDEVSSTINLSATGSFDHGNVVKFNNRYLGVITQWDTSTPTFQIYAKVIDGGEG